MRNSKFNLWSRIFFLFFLLHFKEFKNALPSHTLLLWTHTHFKLTKKIENIIVVGPDPTMARRLRLESLAFSIITGNNVRRIHLDVDGEHNRVQYGVRAPRARKAIKKKQIQLRCYIFRLETNKYFARRFSAL